ncbi:response regulator [Emticicia sp. SJ17W-69]|uniref:response regulator n=1 Tax=Emticicia sp. SJ17W-69 TaxID=3421657 RepID=UPI003EB962C3
MKNIKILLADDHQMFLESMSLLLNTIDGFELVTTAANGREVLRLLDLHQIDIVLCDLHMPLMGGIEVVLQIRQQFPSVKVLILTMSDAAPDIRAALQAGAGGYLLKTSNKNELESAIIGITNGLPYFSNSVITSLAKTPMGNDSYNQLENDKNMTLSDRELEILKLIVAENSSTQIAEKLFISFNTVETHRKHIYKKLGINSSLGLLRYALRNGLVE